MQWERAAAFLRQRFTRASSSVAYIPQLDGLRSLALVTVIAHHVFAIYLMNTRPFGIKLLPQDWGRVVANAPGALWGLHLAFGVNLFFAISGFVLAMPFARTVISRTKMPSIRLYFLRRLIRLEPPYLVSMTFLLLMILTPWSRPHWSTMVLFHIFWPHYLWSIVYLHAVKFGMPSWLGGVAWTLEIEIQFYLLMPVIAQIFRCRSAAVRRGMLAVLVVASSLFVQFVLPTLTNPRIGLSLAGHLEFFLAGILLADIYLNPPAKLRLNAVRADLCAVAGAALLIDVLHYQNKLLWLAPLFVVVFYYGVFHDGWAGRVFRSPLLTVPGVMCYTIYLYHYFLLEKILPHTVPLFSHGRSFLLESTVQMVVAVPLVLLVSAMLYLMIERPFVVLSHTATRRWSPATRPVAHEVAG